ncbi:MAG: hypothetical protein ACRCW9_05905 [Cetobacterium sp.]
MYYEFLNHIFKATRDSSKECEVCIFKDLDCGDYDLIINGLEKSLCEFEYLNFELITCPREILLAKINGVNKLEWKSVYRYKLADNSVLLKLLIEGE